MKKYSMNRRTVINLVKTRQSTTKGHSGLIITYLTPTYEVGGSNPETLKVRKLVATYWCPVVYSSESWPTSMYILSHAFIWSGWGKWEVVLIYISYGNVLSDFILASVNIMFSCTKSVTEIFHTCLLIYRVSIFVGNLRNTNQVNSFMGYQWYYLILKLNTDTLWHVFFFDIYRVTVQNRLFPWIRLDDEKVNMVRTGTQMAGHVSLLLDRLPNIVKDQELGNSPQFVQSMTEEVHLNFSLNCGMLWSTLIL